MHVSACLVAHKEDTHHDAHKHQPNCKHKQHGVVYCRKCNGAHYSENNVEKEAANGVELDEAEVLAEVVLAVLDLEAA